MRHYRILLIDHEPIRCGAVAQHLQFELGYSEVIVHDHATTLDQCIRTRKPDLVLFDVYVSGVNGLELAQELISRHQNVGFILLGVLNEETIQTTGLTLSAAATFSYSRHFVELDRALDQAIAWLERRRAIDSTLRVPSTGTLADVVASLSEFEANVLELAMNDVPNKAIAHRVSRSIKTVEAALARAYQRLMVESRLGALRALMVAGWDGRSPLLSTASRSAITIGRAKTGLPTKKRSGTS